MKTILTEKAERIELLSFKGPQMRAFHLTWITFFFCFFGWFGIAPLMPIVRADLGLTKGQIGNIMIASVAATIFARLLIGRLCDTLGPRLSYTFLLIFGSIPLITIGFANSYESFLLFRLVIGIIGASFVITQYHTSVMFAPKVVGTANAIAGGWGNLGGGVTNMVMPFVFAGIVALGYTNHDAWRLAMMVPGVLLLVLAFVYYRFTQDTPAGNYADLPKVEEAAKKSGSFMAAAKDPRVWVLFLAYGACFGIEITFDNIAALYFVDNFHLGFKEAGILAGIFGVMNLFARALGGIFGDKMGNKYGLNGRAKILALFLALEGMGIVLFSQSSNLTIAIVTMLIFALFLKMSNGATYSIVPFINKKALGSVSGIVGAGGNLGAVIAGFLFKSENISYSQAFMYIGLAVVIVASITAVVSFKKEVEEPALQLTVNG
ncbi:MAG: NarK family nitrate/nitrite MFS transporter [Bacteroidota bacterium]